jgi:hypothetical protein
MENTKTCSICKIEKRLEDFHNLKTGKYGKHSNCKKCRSDYRKNLQYTKPIKGKIKCAKCNVLKDISCYYADKSASTGIQSYCIVCHKEKIYESESKLNGYLSKLLRKLKGSDSEFSLEKYDLLDILKNQNNKCNLTGELLTYYNGKNLTKECYESRFNISVIRLDLDKPYTRENIVLVGKSVAQMKGTLPMGEFKRICKLIGE